MTTATQITGTSSIIDAIYHETAPVWCMPVGLLVAEEMREPVYEWRTIVEQIAGVKWLADLPKYVKNPLDWVYEDDPKEPGDAIRYRLDADECRHEPNHFPCALLTPCARCHKRIPCCQLVHPRVWFAAGNDVLVYRVGKGGVAEMYETAARDWYRAKKLAGSMLVCGFSSWSDAAEVELDRRFMAGEVPLARETNIGYLLANLRQALCLTCTELHLQAGGLDRKPRTLPTWPGEDLRRTPLTVGF